MRLSAFERHSIIILRGIMQFKSVEEIHEALKGTANAMDIEIIDIVYDNKSNALTVFIETEGGVDLDTCEKFHRAIDTVIDELDPSYGQPYTLNVSSPGLDRPFKTKRDFERNLQKEVEIKLYAPLKGKKFIEGVLTEFDENSVTVKTEKEELKISINKIAKINKAIKFD